jgi:hypothetical protein
MNGKTIIKLSKTKFLFTTLGSFAFVALGINLWMIANAQTRVPPIAVQALAIMCILFFGLGAVIGSIKLFDNRPGIIIDQEGINIVGAYFIKWEDINDYSTVQVENTKCLLLYVQNPEDYIASAGRLKQVGMKMSMKMYETPFSISSNAYQCSFDELKNAILEGMKNHALSKRDK